MAEVEMAVDGRAGTAVAPALDTIRPGPRKIGRSIATPRLYARRYFGRVLGQALLIVLVIEVIFMTEKLNDVLRAAADEHVGAAGILLLMLYRVPEIFNLAAPLALLAAVYRVTLGFREERELVALSGIGVGPSRLMLLTSSLGGVMLILSLAVGGFANPAAMFAQRSLLFESSVTALRGGITSGQFYWFGDYTIFARHRSDDPTTRQLFLHQAPPDHVGNERALIARRVSLDGPRADGSLTLHLQDFDSFDFPSARSSVGDDSAAAGNGDCTDCARTSPARPASVVRVGNFQQRLELDDLVRFAPRGYHTAEWTLDDILGLGSSGLVAGPKEIAEFGHRFARGLLCLLAPLVAGLALALTTRRTHTIALPVACALLMGVDFTLSAVSDNLAASGIIELTAALILTVVAVFGAAAAVLYKCQNGMVRPALGRA